MSFRILAIIFVFFVIVSIFARKLYERKTRDIENKERRDFNKRIHDAFAPIIEESKEEAKNDDSEKYYTSSNKEKPKKITCPYCKCKYNSTEDRCPHCGAPPEPYD